MEILTGYSCFECVLVHDTECLADVDHNGEPLGNVEYSGRTIPDNCPLRDGPITIRLEEEA